MRRASPGLLLPALLLFASAAAAQESVRPLALPRRSAPQPAVAVWRLDGLKRVGGHPVEPVGAPRVTTTEIGAAIGFDGARDGLLLDVNPLSGVARFTIEVVFRPDADGPEEQRFLHIEEPASGNRALIELRVLPGGRWALDTYLRHGDTGLTLIDRGRSHPAGRWYSAALVYDGTTMTHYVDGIREMSGRIAFPPLQGGRTSIGVRQNRVSWFKGLIHTVRITPEALTTDRMLGANAVQPRVIPLWPEGVPGAERDAGGERIADGRVWNVHQPTLTVLPPTAPSSAIAVILCPGGGYARLALANEGDGVASRLRPAGVTIFLLKYRLAEYGHPAPLQDVLRAVRLVRARAAEFGVQPGRVGVFGASAGGHVAAAAATLFDSSAGRTGAAIDATSARPDFAALLYPVITMRAPFAHEGSRRNLLGPAPEAALIDLLSLESHVRADTPPVFLVHSTEDRIVPVENSLLFHEALRRAGVPAELHVYEKGPHGFGTSSDLGTTSGWIDRLVEWIASLSRGA